MAKIKAVSSVAASMRKKNAKKNHEPKRLKSVGVWGNESVGRMSKKMKDMIAEIIGLIKAGEVAISVDDGNQVYTASLTEVAVLEGNRKLGKAIWSVSLPPVLYCGNCKQCKNLCYDLRHDVIQLMCRVYRCINAALLEVNGIEWFMSDVERQIKEKQIEFLRHNIGGDVQGIAHLNLMVSLATRFPQLHQLVFTKMYDVVNTYMDNKRSEDANYELPENLHLFFSAWPATKMENPYNFPISFPVYEEEDRLTNEIVAEHMAKMPTFYWHCGNDCTDCALSGCGCWKLGKGEAVGFPLH